MTTTLAHVRALLFDKDGTLFDFQRSWSAWTVGVLEKLAPGDRGQQDRLADLIGFDRGGARFRPGAQFIGGTLAETCDLLLPHLPGEWSADSLRRWAVDEAAGAEMIPPLPLAPLLDGFRGRGLGLGVATNDAESAARQQLRAAGIDTRFDMILGYDSGFTPKPAPDMLLGFAAHLGLDPAAVAMVGDSTHDLHAGRAAGMTTVAVLTGVAGRDALAPHADIVLEDIGGVQALLDAAA
ncbi:HAD family hydrolase [Rhodobacteraceae bacterium 2376]|uniref:phosphoglycolate phosphatase n=1 Tax=Rhabdonatronobacter sediminivivens TaxID=2743469 RepID=A0A7Z0KWM8_9RHOB|nr:HAD family hydrolase [Rhabdonatronobacter sediminivivens]NYS24217.1 HAD family hydrolase [Rhabdonatronobacter sediminivivens]